MSTALSRPVPESARRRVVLFALFLLTALRPPAPAPAEAAAGEEEEEGASARAGALTRRSGTLGTEATFGLTREVHAVLDHP